MFYKRLILTATILLCLPCNEITAQVNNHTNPTTNYYEGKRTFPKHETGFSMGAFPTIGFLDPDLVLDLAEPLCSNIQIIWKEMMERI